MSLGFEVSFGFFGWDLECELPRKGNPWHGRWLRNWLLGPLGWPGIISLIASKKTTTKTRPGEIVTSHKAEIRNPNLHHG